MAWIAIVYFITLNAVVSSSSEEWECSVSHIGNWFGETSIESYCDDSKDEIDQCCLSFDMCYDEQKGRRICDDNLCDCLDEAARSDSNACKNHVPSFCDAARAFGQRAYEDAGHLNEKMDVELELVQVEDDYVASSAIASVDIQLPTILSLCWIVIALI